MNRKGQVTVGLIILAFIGVIVGAVIFDATGENVGTLTNTYTEANRTFTFPEAGSTITLTGQSNTAVGIINNTNGAVVPASNYTIRNYVILSDGTLGSTLTANAGFFNAGANPVVNISATIEPIGYVTDSGSRMIVVLIALFTGLAVASLALIPAVRSGILDMIN